MENARVRTPSPPNVEFSTFFFFDGFPNSVGAPSLNPHFPMLVVVSPLVTAVVLIFLDPLMDEVTLMEVFKV